MEKRVGIWMLGDEVRFMECEYRIAVFSMTMYFVQGFVVSMAGQAGSVA